MIIYDKNIAILFIVFSSSNATQQVFDRIKEVKPKRLYVAIDGPKNDMERIVYEEVKALVSQVDWDCQLFKRYQETNLDYDKHCYQSICIYQWHCPSPSSSEIAIGISNLCHVYN